MVTHGAEVARQFDRIDHLEEINRVGIVQGERMQVDDGRVQASGTQSKGSPGGNECDPAAH